MIIAAHTVHSNLAQLAVCVVCYLLCLGGWSPGGIRQSSCVCYSFCKIAVSFFSVITEKLRPETCNVSLTRC